MHSVKLTLLLFLLFATSVFAGDSWPPVPFTTVRAYSWPESAGKNFEVILPGMKLAPRVINKKGTLLTADQIHRLQAAVSKPNQREMISACYDPHNAFVFYDGANKPVAYLEVCFSCIGHRAEPSIPNQTPNYLSLATIFEELKLPMGRYTTVKAFGKAHFEQ